MLYYDWLSVLLFLLSGIIFVLGLILLGKVGMLKGSEKAGFGGCG